MVFAKSCTPNNWGRTKPGTTIEPVSHFGKVMIAGAVALPTSATVAANAGADTALARVAGGGIMPRGYTWALRGAATAVAESAGAASALNPISLFILGMLPATMGDGTLHQNDQLRGMSHAPTRVRFQFRRDASGALHAYGIHAGPGGDDAVRTVKAEWNADSSAMEAHLNGLTILWIPNKGPQAIPPLIYPDHPGEQLDTIHVHPIPENLDTEIEGYPAGEDITTDDFILTFPADSGLRSLYIVYATSPRLENGVVTGQGQDITGIWLADADKALGAPLPSQIADKLRGKSFSSFDRFREEFWKEVATDPELSSQFSASNLANMREHGYAPRTPKIEQVGKRKAYELHHVEPIAQGGEVYDVGNLKVHTPKSHIDIHRTK